VQLKVWLTDEDEQVVLRPEVPDDQRGVGVGDGGDVADRDTFVAAAAAQITSCRRPGIPASGSYGSAPVL
jgi:hypothetical protein